MRWGGREGEGGLRYVHWLSERERGVCALVMVWREQGGQREGGLRYCIGCRREREGTGGGRVEVCTFAVRERERGVFIGYGMEGARKWEMVMEGLEGEGMGGREGGSGMGTRQ